MTFLNGYTQALSFFEIKSPLIVSIDKCIKCNELLRFLNEILFPKKIYKLLFDSTLRLRIVLLFHEFYRYMLILSKLR